VNVIAFHAARNPGAPRETGRMSLMAWGINVANCLVLGWQDWALDLAQLALWGIDNNAFLDAGKSYHRRIQFFILRLIADWQGWPVRNWPKWATDEPLYNALITHWRTPNPDDLTPLLLAACDRHTHECRYSSGAASYDVEKGGVGTIHSKFLSC
jgi:hypothetical protein